MHSCHVGVTQGGRGLCCDDNVNEAKWSYNVPQPICWSKRARQEALLRPPASDFSPSRPFMSGHCWLLEPILWPLNLHALCLRPKCCELQREKKALRFSLPVHCYDALFARADRAVDKTAGTFSRVLSSSKSGGDYLRLTWLSLTSCSCRCVKRNTRGIDIER